MKRTFTGRITGINNAKQEITVIPDQEKNPLHVYANDRVFGYILDVINARKFMGITETEGTFCVQGRVLTHFWNEYLQEALMSFVRSFGVVKYCRENQ
jgi:hypothetical protein